MLFGILDSLSSAVQGQDLVQLPIIPFSGWFELSYHVYMHFKVQW